jgi:DNA adenine methylase
MRSIYRYPGGKSKVQKKILARAPKHFAEYREPFVGGGGIFFGIDSIGTRRWINDMHPGLIAVYESLRDRSVEFIQMCKDVPAHQPGEKEVAKNAGRKYNERLGKIFNKVKLDDECDQAFRYFFVNRTVWMGRVNYDIPSRLFYSVPEGWDIVKTDRMEQAATHLIGTVITCGSYAKLLEAPGEDVWIYCDPPYVVNTEMTKQDQQYQHNFTLEDHEDFVDAVKDCEHKVCISYDDCDLVREWFEDSQFTIQEEEWKYSGTNLAKKKTGQELIITNY